MLTAEQIAERVNYIGGSDAAAVLGMSRWATPLSVWAEKTGQIVREDTPAFYKTLGHKLEQTVAELFMEETGKKLQRVNETIIHPRHPFMGANVDRRVVGERAIFEAKTASAWKAREWEGEEIPREYIIQAMHYLAVTGADRVYLSVLIGNHAFQTRVIERGEVLAAIEDLVRQEVEFWENFVVPRVMPVRIMSDDRETLERLFPIAAPGPAVELPDSANAIAETLEAQQQDLKMLERSVEKSKNELLALLGSNESGTTGRWDVLWANVVTRRFDLETFKKDHADLFEKYRKPNTSRKFLIRKTSTGGE